FSSRRRHTRCYRDWSSDVCSSDLGEPVGISAVAVTPDGKSWWASGPFGSDPAYGLASFDGHAFKYFDPVRDAGMSERLVTDMVRSEERRVGNEGRCGRWGCACQ